MPENNSCSIYLGQQTRCCGKRIECLGRPITWLLNFVLPAARYLPVLDDPKLDGSTTSATVKVEIAEAIA